MKFKIKPLALAMCLSGATFTLPSYALLITSSVESSATVTSTSKYLKFSDNFIALTDVAGNSMSRANDTYSSTYNSDHSYNYFQTDFENGASIECSSVLAGGCLPRASKDNLPSSISFTHDETSGECSSVIPGGCAPSGSNRNRPSDTIGGCASGCESTTAGNGGLPFAILDNTSSTNGGFVECASQFAGGCGNHTPSRGENTSSTNGGSVKCSSQFPGGCGDDTPSRGENTSSTNGGSGGIEPIFSTEEINTFGSFVGQATLQAGSTASGDVSGTSSLVSQGLNSMSIDPEILYSLETYSNLTYRALINNNTSSAEDINFNFLITAGGISAEGTFGDASGYIQAGYFANILVNGSGIWGSSADVGITTSENGRDRDRYLFLAGTTLSQDLTNDSSSYTWDNYTATLHLGMLNPGEYLALEYSLSTYVNEFFSQSGYSTSARATIGDPFDFNASPLFGADKFVLVSGSSNVPEPAGVALLGAGLLGLAFRRNVKKST